jgi:predicted GNAT family N-acyltransferase
MITVQHITAADTYALRHTILRPNQPLSSCIYEGDEADLTFHLGAFDGDDLVSVGTFIQKSCPLMEAELPYQLRGMATATNYRRKKAGSTLMAEAEAIIRERGSDLFWCNARYHVKDYYISLGFTPIGDIFTIEPYGPHIVMVKKFG